MVRARLMGPQQQPAQSATLLLFLLLLPTHSRIVDNNEDSSFFVAAEEVSRCQTVALCTLRKTLNFIIIYPQQHLFPYVKGVKLA